LFALKPGYKDKNNFLKNTNIFSLMIISTLCLVKGDEMQRSRAQVPSNEDGLLPNNRK